MSKNIPPLACYNIDTCELILIFLSKNVTDKVSNHKCSAVAEMDDRLATIDVDRKWGGALSLWGGGAGSLSNTT